MAPGSAATGPHDVERALLVTPLPWLLPSGNWQAEVRAGVSLREPGAFTGDDDPRIERTVVSLPFEIAAALGDRVEGTARFGAVRTGGKDDSDGVAPSDLHLRLGYSVLAPERHSFPLAAWLSAKAPTGPDRGGVSTDETDLGAGLSAGRASGRLAWFGHAGLELLGNPLRNGAQDDVLSYGAGLRWSLPAPWSIAGEVDARAFSRFGNSAARARLAAAWSGEDRERTRLSAGLAITHGLTDDAATWGVEVVVSTASGPAVRQRTRRKPPPDGPAGASSREAPSPREP